MLLPVWPGAAKRPPLPGARRCSSSGAGRGVCVRPAQAAVFLQLPELRVPLGIMQVDPEGGGAYERHRHAEPHQGGTEHTPPMESTPGQRQTRS